jgi:hypothetical protein
VIRCRPLPGIAHAFVFWGFCAFALVTANHLAMGFGFPFPVTAGLVRENAPTRGGVLENCCLKNSRSKICRRWGRPE